MSPGWPLSVRSEDPAGIGENVRDGQDLWEAVFSRQNLMIALKRVERNRGAAGVDGLRTEELRAWCSGHWTETGGGVGRWYLCAVAGCSAERNAHAAIWAGLLKRPRDLWLSGSR